MYVMTILKHFNWDGMVYLITSWPVSGGGTSEGAGGAVVVVATLTLASHAVTRPTIFTLTFLCENKLSIHIFIIHLFVHRILANHNEKFRVKTVSEHTIPKRSPAYSRRRTCPSDIPCGTSCP